METKNYILSHVAHYTDAITHVHFKTIYITLYSYAT